jgi:hypothetical protein
MLLFTFLNCHHHHHHQQHLHQMQPLLSPAFHPKECSYADILTTRTCGGGAAAVRHDYDNNNHLRWSFRNLSGDVGMMTMVIMFVSVLQPTTTKIPSPKWYNFKIIYIHWYNRCFSFSKIRCSVGSVFFVALILSDICTRRPVQFGLCQSPSNLQILLSATCHIHRSSWYSSAATEVAVMWGVILNLCFFLCNTKKGGWCL